MEKSEKRSSGILLHPTSLPGDYGIGEIGPHAYKFIDDLADMGQNLWQILPIGPTDYHNSPYSSISTFAGNPLIISLDLLIEDGLLNSGDLANYKKEYSSKILFDKIIDFKIPILKKVSNEFVVNASKNMKKLFKRFCSDNSYWLEDFSKYCALKRENNNTCWTKWKVEDIQNQAIAYETKVIQFIFHDQWIRLRKYCQEKGIMIIGDMPIYVGHDSSDVYSNQNLFELDNYGNMKFQSGCPPCNYQKNGQIWKNPLYNWTNHEKTNFFWWRKRFKKLFDMVDIIRLDHFIGYKKYYRIPIESNTAHNGEWFNAPGDKLFQNLISFFPNFSVIAEDLGDVTEEVVKLRDKYNFPGMKVIQFEIDKMLELADFPINSIVCTGTHDNETLAGWIDSLLYRSPDKKVMTIKKLIEFFSCTESQIHWKIIDYALSTSSKFAIIPMQDILNKSSASRFNIPGTLSGSNWTWKMIDGELTETIKNKLLESTKENRNN